MAKCKDGRKNVKAKVYEKKDGAKVSIHECGCPTQESNRKDDLYLCCMCGEEHSINDIHEIDIKGETKNICKECADIVHGLV